VHTSKEQSNACGDGTFEEAWEDEEHVERKSTGLGGCANDVDLGLVSMKLGLYPRVGWGRIELVVVGVERRWRCMMIVTVIEAL
jgi:hypothetical protein